MKLSNKIAIITGGSQGIGEGIALRMGEEGAKVVIFNRTKEMGQKVVEKIKNAGGEAVSKEVDVTDYAAVKKAVEQIHSQFGSIDILVNNVGSDSMKPFLQTDEASWDELIRTNYKTFLICTHVCAGYMVEQKSGKIVSISSDSARAGQMNECLYCGTKGAIITSSKGLAREFARYNINVNVVSPGITETPLIQELKKSEKGEKIIAATTKMIPFRRIGQPSEVGDLVVFFASEDSKYITGQVLSINGGQQMIG